MLAKLRFPLYILPLMTAVLLFMAWPPAGFPLLACISLVPLLLLADIEKYSGFKLAKAYFLGFFVFHLLAGWWMYSSTIIGSLLAHLFNASYMTLVLHGYTLTKRNAMLRPFSALALATMWLSMEFIHLRWELSWPWFTLGHVFSEKTDWIQWYAFTGSMGGSLWVLVTNLLFAQFIRSAMRAAKHQIILKWFLAFLISVGTPIGISYSMKNQASHADALRLMIVQPNIDPRTEKFDGLSQQAQLDKAIRLIRQCMHESVELIMLPETLITDPIEEDSLLQSQWIQQLMESVSGAQKTAVLTGAFTKRSHSIPEADRSALINDTEGPDYVLYNSILLLTDDNVQVYHKTRLVPLVEKQPFYDAMKPIRRFVEQSGGFFGRYGTHNETAAFYLRGIQLTPLICFESVFGAYTATAVADGAGAIVLVTNDGWWSTQGGYRQHLAYARLRAIETNRYVARAANTGVSALIDARGKLINTLPYGQEGCFKASLYLHHERSFYSRFGDYIGSFSLPVALVFIVMLIVAFISLNRKLNRN